jgi:hypothetical protein
MTDADHQREHLRQQMLLQTLCRVAGGDALTGWLREQPAGFQRGLAAYQANAGASAEKALSASFPTVRALVGDDAFAGLARALWHRHPPTRGDLAWFGGSLPGFIADDEQLADVPYLPDMARLDWALARAESAADAQVAPASLALLGEADPADVALALAPGAAVLPSRWPVVTLYQAHHGASEGAADPFGPARAALAAGVAETALVWRYGWKACVLAVGPGEERFLRAVLQSQPLSKALESAGPDLDFAATLQSGLQHGWLAGARSL